MGTPCAASRISVSPSTAPVPASGTKPPTTASLSTMAPRSAPALASQEEEGLLRLQVSGSSTHRAGPPPSATNTVCWACPDRVEGYGQLCANLGGPDAVEGVFQLHSPAKRRHRAVIEAKRPTENPTSALRPAEQAPAACPCGGGGHRGGKRVPLALQDKMHSCEVPKGLSIFTRSLLPPHDTGLHIHPRGSRSLLPQAPWTHVLQGSHRPLPTAQRRLLGHVAGGLCLLPLTHVEDEEAEGANSYGSNLLPVPREAVPLVLVLIEGWGGEVRKNKLACSPLTRNKSPEHPLQCPPRDSGIAIGGHGNHPLFCRTHHHVLPAEDDPKRQQHGVENALPNVSKEQHPRPVKPDGKPLHWDVNERHGNSQSKDDPAGTETPALPCLQGGDPEPQKPERCLASDEKTPHCLDGSSKQGGTRGLT